MPYSAKAVANYFLDLAEREGKKLSPMKLQKLVYFAHGWHLAINGKPLLNEQVEAWPYGPVISSLYHEFKDFGSGAIDRRAIEFFEDEPQTVPAEDADTRSLLNKVWDEYKGYTAIQLSNMTHEPGSPWRKTWEDSQIRGTDIPADQIRDYFIMPSNKEKIFLFTYRHDGAEWVFEVRANDAADAKARVAKMAYATYDGELVMKLPASFGVIPRFIVSVRNGLSRLFAYI